MTILYIHAILIWGDFEAFVVETYLALPSVVLIMLNFDAF